MEAPSVETISQLLRKCEQSTHKGGWDQPPEIAAVCWQPGSKLIMLDTDIKVLGRTPIETITALGEGFLKEPACGQAVNDEIGQSFFGFAHIWEAWQAREVDLEQADSWMNMHAVPEDRVEVRVICVVDLYARPYTIRRIRGRKPEIYTMASEIQPFGAVHTGLADMVLGSIQQMPWAADLQLELELFEIDRLHELIRTAHSVE